MQPCSVPQRGAEVARARAAQQHAILVVLGYGMQILGGRGMFDVAAPCSGTTLPSTCASRDMLWCSMPAHSTPACSRAHQLLTCLHAHGNHAQTAVEKSLIKREKSLHMDAAEKRSQLSMNLASQGRTFQRNTTLQISKMLPQEALDELIKGNARFILGETENPHQDFKRLAVGTWTTAGTQAAQLQVQQLCMHARWQRLDRCCCMVASLLQEIAPHQTPFAAVLACSDSRAPVEIVFDQVSGCAAGWYRVAS